MQMKFEQLSDPVTSNVRHIVVGDAECADTAI